MLNVSTQESEAPVWTPDWASIPDAELTAIQAAGLEVKLWMDVLARSGDNVVTDFLRGVEELTVDQIYPEDTVEDQSTGSQYYFHAHSDRDDEYGHFHTYVMPGGMPAGMRAPKPAVAGEHADSYATHCHLVAISMGDAGQPAALFTINHWSTQEACYAPEQVLSLIDVFEVNHAAPSWPVNRWVSSMLRFFKPQIAALLETREAVLQEQAAAHPEQDPAADESLEVVSQVPIDVDQQLLEVTFEMNRRSILPGAAMAGAVNGNGAMPVHA